jgi:uncharacterized membrane protein
MKKLNQYFLTGLLVTLPLVLSIYILVFLFKFMDGILGRLVNEYIKKTLGFYVPGMGIILFLFLILVVGFVSVSLGARFLPKYLDKIIGSLPILKHIYTPVKQMFEFVFSANNMAFKKAVLIEFPCKGNWSLGFVTNETFKEAKDKLAADLLNIFVPLAPNPITGFVVLVRKADVIFLDIEIKEAMKLILSGGLLNPQELIKKSPDRLNS